MALVLLLAMGMVDGARAEGMFDGARAECGRYVDLFQDQEVLMEVMFDPGFTMRTRVETANHLGYLLHRVYSEAEGEQMQACVHRLYGKLFDSLANGQITTAFSSGWAGALSAGSESTGVSAAIDTQVAQILADAARIEADEAEIEADAAEPAACFAEGMEAFADYCQQIVGDWAWWTSHTITFNPDCTFALDDGVTRGLWECRAIDSQGGEIGFVFEQEDGYSGTVFLNEDLSAISGRDERGGVIFGTQIGEVPDEDMPVCPTVWNMYGC